MARGESGSGRTTGALLSGPLLWLFLFFILPVVLIVLYSIGALHLLPTDHSPVSFAAWKKFLTGYK